jgi:hypothetical protein
MVGSAKIASSSIGTATGTDGGNGVEIVPEAEQDIGANGNGSFGLDILGISSLGIFSAAGSRIIEPYLASSAAAS